MIQTEVGLRQTIDVLKDMYTTLGELHQRIAPQNFDNYLIMAEGPLEEIRRAQQEINEYLGLSNFLAVLPDEDRRAG